MVGWGVAGPHGLAPQGGPGGTGRCMLTASRCWGRGAGVGGPRDLDRARMPEPGLSGDITPDTMFPDFVRAIFGSSRCPS